MSEPVLLKQHQLPNGLLLELYDTSRHYYGGYWRVVIEARCQVPLSAAQLEDYSRFDEVARLLGDPVLFIRNSERMAVPQAALEEVRHELLERLEQHLVPLTADLRFASRFIETEFQQRRKRPVRGIPCLQ